VVGRLAPEISKLLVGKHKPIYTPGKDCGDMVVVVNAREVVLTGKKWDQKLYRSHTGYPGGLVERKASWMIEHKPEEVLRSAVMGMLPKNRWRKEWARRLRIFPQSMGEAALSPFARFRNNVRG
jgi:large subunit ribosomal protein L13